ncbi:MAG TPA: hypothetical protein VFY14_13950 [Streptomyces sp.]|nr:hypothetical protein [Streptomyces sp.]
MAHRSSPRGWTSALSAAPLPGLSGVRNRIVPLLMVLTGFWLFLGSGFLRYPFTGAAQIAQLNESGVGIVVVFIAGARLIRPRGWVPDLVVLVLGCWLAVAHILVVYGGTGAPSIVRTNETATGAVLAGLAVVSLLLLFRVRATGQELERAG